MILNDEQGDQHADRHGGTRDQHASAGVFHGVASEIEQCNEDYIFEGIPRQFVVGRYHSWVVDKTNLPEVLVITSIDSQGAIMSLKHRELNVRGVQFHPESIMTIHGKKMIENWLFASTNV